MYSNFHQSPCHIDLSHWFLLHALPLWSNSGIDRSNGGFYELLKTDLQPIHVPRRARLIARQIYFFSTGASLGWTGPVTEIVDNGYSYLKKHLVSSSGAVCSSCMADGQLVDGRQQLYDAAFVVLGLAKVAQITPFGSEAEYLARRVIENLKINAYGGYIDLSTPDIQCSNPHMHLFEALLEWIETSNNDSRFWFGLSSQIADLVINRLIHPESGGIPEFFDNSWHPLIHPYQFRIEPGHQFEWSWLLNRWAKLTSDTLLIDVAARLCYFAERYGVDSERNVVIESLGLDLTPTSKVSKLWQQAERLKAWHQLSSVYPTAQAELNKMAALNTFNLFLSHQTCGLWFDEMDDSGCFLTKPVKASSGYHIACAINTISSVQQPSKA